jgi:hypothetical protein
VNFSAELAVLIVLSTIGLVFSSLSLRYAHLNYRAVVILRDNHPEIPVSQDLIDGRAHLRSTQVLLVIGWAGWLLLGALATLPVPPNQPVGATPVGLVIRYLLLGSIALWSLMTARDYLYGRKMWNRRSSAYEQAQAAK